MALFGKPYEYSDYAPWGILKADSHFQTASRIVSTDDITIYVDTSALVRDTTVLLGYRLSDRLPVFQTLTPGEEAQTVVVPEGIIGGVVSWDALRELGSEAPPFVNDANWVGPGVKVDKVSVNVRNKVFCNTLLCVTQECAEDLRHTPGGDYSAKYMDTAETVLEVVISSLSDTTIIIPGVNEGRTTSSTLIYSTLDRVSAVLTGCYVRNSDLRGVRIASDMTPHVIAADTRITESHVENVRIESRNTHIERSFVIDQPLPVSQTMEDIRFVYADAHFPLVDNGGSLSAYACLEKAGEPERVEPGGFEASDAYRVHCGAFVGTVEQFIEALPEDGVEVVIDGERIDINADLAEFIEVVEVLTKRLDEAIEKSASRKDVVLGTATEPEPARAGVQFDAVTPEHLSEVAKKYRNVAALDMCHINDDGRLVADKDIPELRVKRGTVGGKVSQVPPAGSWVDYDSTVAGVTKFNGHPVLIVDSELSGITTIDEPCIIRSSRLTGTVKMGGMLIEGSALRGVVRLMPGAVVKYEELNGYHIVFEQ